MVWQFYTMRRQKHLEVKPNPAHFALAELEQRLGDRFFLCTQNVDSLHEAGRLPARAAHAWATDDDPLLARAVSEPAV